METLRALWQVIADDPATVIFAVILLACIGLVCWVQWSDYQQCMKDYPAYLCRSLIFK